MRSPGVDGAAPVAGASQLIASLQEQPPPPARQAARTKWRRAPASAKTIAARQSRAQRPAVATPGLAVSR